MSAARAALWGSIAPMTRLRSPACPPSRRHRLAAFAAAVLLALGPGPAAAQDPAPAWQRAPDLGALVVVLEDWLNGYCSAPQPATPPDIRFVAPERALELYGAQPPEGAHIRGLYDPATDVIYLVRPWSRHEVQDVGTLVHELAHRRMTELPAFRCRGEEELSACNAQATWLHDQGAELKIDWFAAELAARCSSLGAVHP